MRIYVAAANQWNSSSAVTLLLVFDAVCHVAASTNQSEPVDSPRLGKCTSTTQWLVDYKHMYAVIILVLLIDVSPAELLLYPTTRMEHSEEGSKKPRWRTLRGKRKEWKLLQNYRSLSWNQISTHQSAVQSASIVVNRRLQKTSKNMEKGQESVVR